ncbi:MAG: hypothetical protein ACYCPS_03480 [Candidatus Saccharimonadales bacterium]
MSKYDPQSRINRELQAQQLRRAESEERQRRLDTAVRMREMLLEEGLPLADAEFLDDETKHYIKGFVSTFTAHNIPPEIIYRTFRIINTGFSRLTFRRDGDPVEGWRFVRMVNRGIRGMGAGPYTQVERAIVTPDLLLYDGEQREISPWDTNGRIDFQKESVIDGIVKQIADNGLIWVEPDL